MKYIALFFNILSLHGALAVEVNKPMLRGIEKVATKVLPHLETTNMYCKKDSNCGPGCECDTSCNAPPGEKGCCMCTGGSPPPPKDESAKKEKRVAKKDEPAKKEKKVANKKMFPHLEATDMYCKKDEDCGGEYCTCDTGCNAPRPEKGCCMCTGGPMPLPPTPAPKEESVKKEKKVAKKEEPAKKEMKVGEKKVLPFLHESYAEFCKKDRDCEEGCTCNANCCDLLTCPPGKDGCCYCTAALPQAPALMDELTKKEHVAEMLVVE